LNPQLKYLRKITCLGSTEIVAVIEEECGIRCATSEASIVPGRESSFFSPYETMTRCHIGAKKGVCPPPGRLGWLHCSVKPSHMKFTKEIKL
jgi:hypothetical protein